MGNTLRCLTQTLAALLLYAAFPVDSVKAQNTFGLVVTTCGSPPTYPVAGSPGPPTYDPQGRPCPPAGGGSAVSIADGADVAQGTTTDAACATDNGNCTEIALLKRENQRLTSILTAIGSPFQAGAALAANQSINVAQINGVTPLMGNGTTGTGSHRITVANDNTIPTGWPTAANQSTGNASLANIATNTGTNAYETVAASQTGQALGATGATGDYLSHCVIYPTTTTPGVVTVFDNTSTAGANVIAFPGGASSVSNLVPFSIPVGAVSTSGAWKVTTGANLVVTCYGRFT